MPVWVTAILLLAGLGGAALVGVGIAKAAKRGFQSDVKLDKLQEEVDHAKKQTKDALATRDRVDSITPGRAANRLREFFQSKRSTGGD